jgi:hypothetical protein
MEKSAVENKVKEQSKVSNPLANITGKWSVKPCRKSWLHTINPNHDGNTIFSGAQIWIVAARSASNPDVVITGLTEEEREAFEKEMFLQPGALSSYNLKFWADKKNTIKIPKEGLTLDCDNNVKHKLWFKVLSASKRVAKGKEDLAVNSIADVLLSSVEQEAKFDSEKINTKTKAYVKFSSMSLQDKINYLKVFNEGASKVDTTTKPDLIEQTLGNIVENDPQVFLDTFDNPYFKDYVLLEDLLSKNIITRKGGKFFINGGVEIGISKMQVITNLRSDDFQETKIGLIAKLNATK